MSRVDTAGGGFVRYVEGRMAREHARQETDWEILPESRHASQFPPA